MTDLRLPGELAALAQGVELRLLIVRHAQTEYNVDHVMQGWSDSPITELGEQQILAVGEVLASTAIDAAFSSDLARTRATALGIAASHAEPLEFEFRQDLREWNFGGHEEQPSSVVWSKLLTAHGLEIDRELTAVRSLADRMPWSEIFDNIADLDETGQSERAAETVERADAALEHVIRTSAARAKPGEMCTALIVSHGGFITTLLRQLAPAVTPNVILPNCSISSVRAAGDSWELEGVGVAPQDFGGSQPAN